MPLADAGLPGVAGVWLPEVGGGRSRQQTWRMHP